MPSLGTKVDRLPYSNGSDSSLASALVSTRDTVSVSFKYSVVLCLEVRVRPGLLTTRTVTMGLIDVDCHNQLLGHLPACSRSGGPSHAHIGSRCRLSTALIFAQHDGGGPPVWWSKSTSGFFGCHQVYTEVERAFSQCFGSSTRTPHWQFLLVNREEKSSGSGSQKMGTPTFHAPW